MLEEAIYHTLIKYKQENISYFFFRYEYGYSRWGRCNLCGRVGNKYRTSYCLRKKQGEEPVNVENKFCSALPPPTLKIKCFRYCASKLSWNFFHLFFNIIFIVKRWHSSRDVSTEWSEPQENLRIWWDSKLRPQLFAGICSTTEHTCPELDTRELNHIISSFRRINSTYIYKNDSNGGCVGSVTRFIGNLTDLVKPCVDSFVVYLQGRI